MPSFNSSQRILCVLIVLIGSLSGWLPAECRAQAYAGPLTRRAATHEDTVQAVRRLFAARSKVGAGMASYGAVSAGAVGAFALMPLASSGWSSRMPASSIALGLGFGTAGLVAGLKRMNHYSDKRRDEVLAAYAQGEALPEFVLRQLKPEYFGAGRQHWVPAMLGQLRNRLR